MRQVSGTKFLSRVAKDKSHVANRLSQTWNALNKRYEKGGDVSRGNDRYDRRSFLFQLMDM